MKLRKELGLVENSELVLRIVDGELRLHTREAALQRAGGRLGRLKKPGESVVSEFLDERRQEVRRELEDQDR
jgi:hypothetical protein